MAQLDRLIFNAPKEKGAAQRALICAALAEGDSDLLGFPRAADAVQAIQTLEKTGVKYRWYGDNLRVRGCGGDVRYADDPLHVDCGGSRATLNFLAFYVALPENAHAKLDGDASLQNRPIGGLAGLLSDLGVACEFKQRYDHGRGELMETPPLEINGRYSGGSADVKGFSSQAASGAMMAAPATKNGLQLRPQKLPSWPYLELTEEIMQDFGADVRLRREEIEVAQGRYVAREYAIPGSWSLAAFQLVAGAVYKTPVEVHGLALDTQGDRVIMDYLKAGGCETKYEDGVVKLTPPEHLRSIECNLIDNPDLFPPLVALAVAAKGDSVFKGTYRLIFKESNRPLELKEELAKVGVKIEVMKDSVVVHGAGSLKNLREHDGLFETDDHRIAMALSLLYPDKEMFANPECTYKSDEGWWNRIRPLRDL